MVRIACLLVPDLPVAAVCRADPDRAGRPLVLTDVPGAHARVVAASVEARALGVRPGHHTAAQARAYATDLTVRRRDPVAESSARRALVDVAASLADRIEQTPDGTVFHDADGSTHLAGSEAGLATALVARAARVGLAARSAVASSMVVARLAARYGHGTEVVPAGTARGFLAPLPLACLEPPPAAAPTLARWGIPPPRQLGQPPPP